MRKKRLFFLWLSLLLCAVGARAQESELTVYEGTAESNLVPAYLFYFDDFTRSQFVIPANELEDMGTGAEISALKFYTTNQNVPYTSVSVADVYLMEVGYTTISAFEPKSSATIVYQGTLDIVQTDTGGELTITFSTPFTYQGGNLLVGIENTTDAGYKNIIFLGQTVTGASVAGSNDSSLDNVTAAQRNFIPQTTLYYTPGEAPTCESPTNLAVTDVTTESATLSWTSNASAWDLKVNDVETENVTENPYTLSVEPGTTYTVQVRTNCGGGDMSAWSTPITFTTPFCNEEEQCLITLELTDSYGDGWNGNAIRVVDQETGIVLGTFANTSDADKGVAQSYTLAVCPGRTLSFQWVKGSYPSEASAVVKDVNEEEIFSFAAGGASNWANGYEIATYLVDCTETTCKMPTDLAVSSVEARSAIVSWTSEADAFELRYKAEGDEDYTVVESAITETTYTLDNLTPETTYLVSVRAVCSAEDQSKWTGDATFTTLESCKKPTGWNGSYIATEAHQLSIGWYAGDTNQDTWEVAYIDAANLEAHQSPDEAWTTEIVSTPYFTATGLQPSTRYYFAVRAVCGDETSNWIGPSYMETTGIAPTDLVAKGVTFQSANLAWKGYSCAYDVRYTKLEDFNEPYVLRYDNNSYYTGVGSTTPGTWTWGVMYPGKMITGTQLTQIAIYETSYNTEDFTVNIYSGGDDAPSNMIGTQTVTPLGEDGWHMVTLETPITINKGENLWITLTETGTYVINACQNTEPNNQWVYNGGWNNIGDLVSSLAGYGWMIRANIVPQEGATTTWIAETTTSETAYALSGLDPETYYAVQVRTNCEADGDLSDWETIFFTTLAETAPVTDVVAENITSTSADIDWTVNGAEQEWNVRYRPTGTENATVWDFEDGIGEWTTIDADGDGKTWVSHINTGTGNFNAHSGVGIMTSASYDDEAGVALNPDNWLVSPQIELGGIVTFWVRAQDADWSDENFAVYVSTRGNEVSDFRLVMPETLATGEYVMYTINLSSYSGQGYIAFRHFNCSDMFYLNIDDITLLPAGATEEPWTEVNGVTEIPVTIEGLTPETEYEVQVQSVYADNTTSEWTASTLFTTSKVLIVLDNDYDQPAGQKNTDILEENMGKTVDITIQGRTLYKDGSWNTIILPFSMTKEQFDASPLAGATINAVDLSSTVVGTHVNLVLFEVSQELLESEGFSAGYPFFVKWESGENIVDPTFTGVVIEESEDPFSQLNNDATIFSIGQYSSLMMYPPEELTGDDDALIYYLGSDNKLRYTGKQRLLNAFRHAFVFRATDGSALPAGELDFTLNFDDGTTTGIVEVDGTKTSTPEGYYNIQGMKLNNAPKQKGIYITNGKKFIVK